MTTRKLEPSPRWCCRAYETMRSSFSGRIGEELIREYEAAQEPRTYTAAEAEPLPDRVPFQIIACAHSISRAVEDGDRLRIERTNIVAFRELLAEARKIARKIAREEIAAAKLCEKSFLGDLPDTCHSRFYLKPGENE